MVEGTPPSRKASTLIGVPADLLFNDGHLSTSLDEQARKLVAEVEAAPADHVLQTDAEEWAAALVRRWSVQVPKLDVDAMWQDEPKEVQVDVRHDGMRAILDYSQPAWWPGFRVTVHIPFTGEADVFRLRPNSYTYNPPRANVGPNEITEVIEYPHKRPVDIAAHARVVLLHRRKRRHSLSKSSGVPQPARVLSACASSRSRSYAGHHLVTLLGGGVRKAFTGRTRRSPCHRLDPDGGPKVAHDNEPTCGVVACTGKGWVISG